MTHRNPVSIIQPIWFNSQQVDDNDLNTEQNHNDGLQIGIVNNHIGSGVLLEVLNQNILFDSLLISGALDGLVINVQKQPGDSNFGNQLEVELTNSMVAGKKTAKMVIIGLDFQGNLQYDTFVFKINEKQFTKKHYTNILTVLFNDLIGSSDQSFNLGGRITIKEASPFSISRDSIMVAQDVEPNLFFRDFFVSSSYFSLNALLIAALPLYNIDNLNIDIGFKENKILIKNDVTSQIGEKFVATTNNIEKITVLLSIQNTDPGMASNLIWHGNLEMSIYPLQSTVSCPSDLLPNLAIEFSPFNIPLAQLSIDIVALQNQGILLDGTPQPVDFVFSSTPVANGFTIIPGNYYAFTLKRSGTPDQCDILITSGSNHLSNSRVTTFTGTTWVDIPEDNLWFQISTDAMKVSDGQAYETGHGITLPKTIQDLTLNVIEDYTLSNISFTGTGLFTSVLASKIGKSVPLQDQRTGEPVDSRQQLIPNVQLLNSLDLANLEMASEPLLIGTIIDKNQKSFNPITINISANLHYWNFIKNTLVIKMIDDITDGYRYDTNVLALVTNFVNGDFVNAKIIPDAINPAIFYRIAGAKLCSMIYGDINGDGIVDGYDLALAESLLGSNINSSPPLFSSFATFAPGTVVPTNGYTFLTNTFINDSSIHFQIVNPITTVILAQGSDGILVSNPNNPALASFQSNSVNFSTISNIGNMQLVILTSTTQQNIGSSNVLSIDITSNHIIDIEKLFYTSDIMRQILRADIDGDMQVTSNDIALIQNYIQKTPPFPSQTNPANKIGTQFNALILTIDPFLYNDLAQTSPDRTDDFSASTPHRATTLHMTQDILVSDGYLQNHNFLLNPVQFNITKQFGWQDYLIVTSGNARPVSTIFTSETGAPPSLPKMCERYGDPQSFDSGRIDVFIPNNLILNYGSEIVQPDGYIYKLDWELGTIILEIPPGLTGVEKSIDLFGSFVYDSTGNGITRMGYRAMQYGDKSFVQPNDLFMNRVRFGVSVQAFSPNLAGADIDGYAGIIVDGKAGIYINQLTGQLIVNFTNLYQDPSLQTLSTKIEVLVFLKKAGFNNVPLSIDSATVLNLLT